MKELKEDDAVCVSENKVVGLCCNCLRNVNQFDLVGYEKHEVFTPEGVKNFKTKVHFKCDGFISKDKNE